MIEIEPSLLTQETLDNLISNVITRESTNNSEQEAQFVIKKAQLLQKLARGEAMIIYHSKEGFFDIIGVDGKAIKYNYLNTMGSS